MKISREVLVTTLLLLLVLAANAVWLAPELTVARVDLNDNVLHFTLIERMVQTIEQGGNPLDFWSPEWGMGYPVMRTYQPLAHGLVALIYFALGKSIGLMTVFVWVRYLALVLMPLSFFAAARLMGFPRWTAFAAALLSPLLSTEALYGLDFSAFTWYGTGLFPQLIAAHLLLLTLGLGCRAIRRGRGLTVTGALLGLTFLAHLIYGYMGALTICLMAAVPDAENPLGARLKRLVWIGGAAVAAAAFQLAPLLRDVHTINHSVWEADWKWDSFGAFQGALLFATGKLLDYGRIPVLTLLAVGGAAMVYRKRDWLTWFATLGGGLWLLMFFGRRAWGPVLPLLGVMPDMHLHRVIGGVHIFMVLLAAMALAEFWRYASQRWHVSAAAAATIVVLAPLVWERAVYLNNDAAAGEANLSEYQSSAPELKSALAGVDARGGRTYAGLATAWGAKFKVGEVPVYAFLSTAQIPALGFLYHAMSLPGDVMLRFDQMNPAHYRLFNIRNVLTPDFGGSYWPAFVQPRERIGQFQLYETPGGGYFDLVDVPASVQTTKHNFYGTNERWLASDWVGKRLHLWLDWDGDAPRGLIRAKADDTLPEVGAQLSPAGEVQGDRRTGEVYEADLTAARNCFALFKMTWHRNWKALVDGVPATTAMLSPGFVGVPISAGRHHITMRYEPGNEKLLLGLAGGLILLLLAMVEHKGWAAGWEQVRVAVRLRREWLVPAGIGLLAAPICIPLLTSQVLWGHDSMCYFTRLTEEHQNLTNGILLARWAPDFGYGTGQPLFVFHPPLFYWLGELFHLAGFSFTAAANAVCVLIVLGSAGSMFLLAQLYFGRTGAWLAAAAYLYAPYFAVDLFVRSALEEFTSFPFLALAMYGFGAYALYGKRRHWLVGVGAYAAVMFSSFPASLLYSPLLAAFVVFTAWRARRWKVLWMQIAGVAFGLALSVSTWLPAMLERKQVWMDRVLDGPVRYSDHLLTWYQLFYSPWNYGLSVPGPHDFMSFALGWSHLLVAVAALVWVERRGKESTRWLVRFFGVAGLIICLVMIEQMQWLWDAVPLLQFVELPWRLLGTAILCLAMLAGSLGALLDGLGGRRNLAVGALLALLIAPNLNHLHPKDFHDVDPALWTPQRMAETGWDSTTQGEVTPHWVELTPFYNPKAAETTGGDAQMRQVSAAFDWSADVTAKTASTVRISRAYFPGWEARLDGRPVESRPAPMSGLILIDIPQGEHRAEIRWTGTPVERWSGWASLLMLAVWLALLARGDGKQLGISGN